MLKKIQFTPQQQKRLSILLEASFLLFLFLFYLQWACKAPFNHGPDEYMRYNIADFIYKYGTLPHGGDPLLRDPTWGISYGFNPIMSYIFSGLFMKIGSLFSTDPTFLLHAARLVNVIWGVLTAFFTIRIAKKLLPAPYRPVFIALVTLLPQMVYLTSYVNTDAMAVTSTSVIIYMWILGLESHWDKKSCIGLGIGLAMCALSYYNAYGFILCSIFFFAFSALYLGDKKFDYQTLLKRGILISVVTLALAAWWFIRSYIIYDGDILGMATSRKYAELYGSAGYKPSEHETYKKLGASLFDMIFDKGGWFETTKFSFIGCFGYMERFLAVETYSRYIYPIALGGFGVIASFITLFRPRKQKQWQKENILHLTLAIAMIIPVILSVYYSYASDYQAQGRYVMPMIIPLMYFACKGFQQIGDYMLKPKRAYLLTYSYTLILLITLIQTYKNIFLPMFEQ